MTIPRSQIARHGIHASAPPFRTLVGAEVLVRALPKGVMNACDMDERAFSLGVLSGGIDKAWLGPARSPSELAQRFSVPKKLLSGLVPIHLTVSHDDLGAWHFQAKFSLLAYYPLTAADLPNIQYAQGVFGATIVDFVLYQDNLRQALEWCASLKTAPGEIVAIAPVATADSLGTLSDAALAFDPEKTTPVSMLGTIAVVFAKEGQTPDQRFSGNNEYAAWCEALDYTSLSPRLELRDRIERIGGLKGVALHAHYTLARRFRLYRAIANRIAATPDFLDSLESRTATIIEYWFWRLRLKR